MSAKKKTQKKTQNTVKFTTRPNPFPEAKGKDEYFGTVIPNGAFSESDIVDMVASSKECPFERHAIQRILTATWRKAHQGAACGAAAVAVPQARKAHSPYAWP